MELSIYLHKHVVETLKCYGELDEVVNRILTLAENDEFEIFDLPHCQSRDGATRYNIDVTNQYYLELLATFPQNSPRISLRRILYYFVEQELYDAYEWETVNEYKNIDEQKCIKKLRSMESDMQRLMRRLPSQWKGYADTILEHLINLREVITNG